MKLTKSHKIYLGVLGAAVCALVWNQTTASPKSPLHPLVPPSSVANTGSTQSPVNQPLTSEDVVSVGLRLKRLGADFASSSNVRDAFIPSDNWIPNGGVSHTIDRQATEFTRSHHLKLVILRCTGSVAMVDNSLISIGQTLDGFQLRSVNKVSALFADGETMVELRLLGSEVSAASTTDR